MSYLCVCIFLIGSCKKKDKATPANQTSTSTTGTSHNPPQTPTAADYMPLRVGNYWVYHIYIIDSVGTKTDGGYDSMYISAKIVKGSRTYYTLNGIGQPMNILDSVTETYDDSGHRIFSISDFTDTISRVYNSQNKCWISYIMVNKDSQVTVSAGQFHCFDRLGKMLFDSSWKLKDRNRTSHYFFSKGIGVVYMTYQDLLDAKSYSQYQLERYKVQ